MAELLWGKIFELCHPWVPWAGESGRDEEITWKIETSESLPGCCSASGQDEPNPVLQLATQAGMMERYCPLGIARFVPATTFRQVQAGARKSSFTKYFA